MRRLETIPTALAAALAVALVTPVPAAAQSASDEEPAARSADGEEAAVRSALQHYLEGHATGDGAHHRRIFHPEAELHWMRDGELRTRTSEAYVAGAPGEPAADESERTRRIAIVDVTGDAAVAKIVLDYPGALITDYMSLLKVDGEWRIVNKIFHVERRPGSEAGAP